MSEITFTMKLKIIYIRQILILVFLIICYHQEVISQGTDISSGKSPSLYIGLSLGPSQSSINNEGTLLSVLKLNSSKKGSFIGFMEIGYFFSNYFGLSSGIGFISNKTQLTLKSYQINFDTIDSEMETYERSVTGSDIIEVQKIGFLSVPFCINLRLPINEKTGFFLQTGVNLVVPLSKNYSSSGTFTYKGYYPAYNVWLENLPTHDFPSNKSIITDGKLELKPLEFNASASVGIDFFIQEKMQIAAAVCYDKSLSNISNYSAPDKFQLSTDADQINSLMGGSSKATVQSLGLKIIFRYYLK